MKANNILVKEERSKFQKFFSGDFGLAKTYWGFYFTVKLLVLLLSEIIAHFIWEISDSEIFSFALDVFYVVTATYFILIVLPVWKAALKYKGNYLWSALAILSVSISALYTAGDFYLYVKNYNNLHYQEKEAIELLNQALPAMIDDITQINRVTLEDNILIYELKVVSHDKSFLNNEATKSEVHSNIVNSVCSSKDKLDLLINYDGIIYEYSDKNNNYLFSIPVSLNTCIEFLKNNQRYYLKEVKNE